MPVTKERFEQGLTYQQYKAALTRNLDRFEENERGAVLDPAAIAAFRALPRAVNVLVLSEDWCGDCVNNVPVLARIAEASGTLRVRFFKRDEHKDLMQRYLKDGKFESIPVFVFFDEAMREIGHWIERPASVDELRGRRRREIYASDPAFGSPDAPAADLPEDVRARLTAAIQAMREETRPFANAEVIRELRELVTAGARA